LTEVQGQLATLRDEVLEVQRRNNQLASADIGLEPVEQRDRMRVQMEREIERGNEIILEKQRRTQDLQAQAAALMNALSAEQARWTEFNSRLDDIERSLTPAGR
jgi:hypothetical protein